MADPLQSLLTWSIANTDTSNRSSAPRAALHPSDNESSGPEVQLAPSSNDAAPTPQLRSDLTSDMLDHIMGKGDAVIMREKLNIALDDKLDIDERVFALDDFEMLIELIDNACNIENMQMWPSILSLLESAQDPVIAHACWICGTAIQNNDKAQQAFLTHNPLPRIYSLISSVHPTNSSVTISPQTRAKAVYALSAALKHNPQALSSLNKESRRGWGVLRQGLRDPEGTIRRKIAFLIGTLIMQSGEGANGSSSSGEMVAALKENGLTEALMSSLTDPLPLGPDGSEEPDHDLLEKSFRALVGIAEKDGLSVEQKSSLSNVITRWGKEEGGWDQVGLSDSEAKDALNLLSK